MFAGAARAAQEEAARLEAAIASVGRQRERDLAALTGLITRLAEAEEGAGGAQAASPGAEAPEAPNRDSLVAAASAAVVPRISHQFFLSTVRSQPFRR